MVLRFATPKEQASGPRHHIGSAPEAATISCLRGGQATDHESLFEQRVEVLSPFLTDDPDIVQRIHRERSLWAIYAMDFQTLESLLMCSMVEVALGVQVDDNLFLPF